VFATRCAGIITVHSKGDEISGAFACIRPIIHRINILAVSLKQENYKVDRAVRTPTRLIGTWDIEFAPFHEFTWNSDKRHEFPGWFN